MSNYDLTLKKEVTREFAWEVMGRIRLIQLKKEHKNIERDTDLAPVLFFYIIR